MNEEINLLKGKKTSASPLLSRLFALRAASLSVLFGVSFFSISLFILIALSPLQRLQDQESSEVQKVTLFHPKMAKILLTKERLGHINTILQTRPVYHELLEQVTQQLPNDTSIDTIKLETSKLTISASSPSLGNIETFISNIQELNSKKKYFGKISLLNMYLNTESGRYISILEMISSQPVKTQ